MIAHSIAQARASGLFSQIAISSDSEEILAVGKEWGADVLVHRPDDLASDTAPKIPAIRHCLEQAEAILGQRFDIFVDLDATSPLRLPEDIVGAVDLLRSSGAPNVITGAKARRSPYFNLVEQTSDGTVKLSKTLETHITRRQDSPRCYDMNASIYAWNRDAFLSNPAVFYPETRLYEMPEDRSIDVDSELDFEMVSFLMARRGRN